MTVLSEKFRNAEFYRGSSDESVDHRCWDEAIQEIVESRFWPQEAGDFERQVKDMCPIDVEAYDKTSLTEREAERYSEILAERFVDEFTEDYVMGEFKPGKDMEAVFKAAVKDAWAKLDVRPVHEVARVSFEFDEVWEIVRE